MGLARINRLKTGSLFRKTLNQRKLGAHTALCILVLPQLVNVSLRRPLQVGIVISKKVHKRAHERHKIRRRLREIIRRDTLTNQQLLTYRTLVIIVRPPAITCEFSELRRQLLSLLPNPKTS